MKAGFPETGNPRVQGFEPLQVTFRDTQSVENTTIIFQDPFPCLGDRRQNTIPLFEQFQFLLQSGPLALLEPGFIQLMNDMLQEEGPIPSFPMILL